MKKSTKFILIIAACCLVAGIALFAASAFLNRSSIPDAFNQAVRTFSDSKWSLYKDFDNEYSPDGTYSVTGTFDRLELHWSSGSVEFVYHSGSDEIYLTETSEEPITQENALRWGFEKGTLYVYDYHGGWIREAKEKHLTVSLPSGVSAQAFSELSIGTASAEVIFRQDKPLALSVLEIGTASGDVFFASGTDGRTAGKVRISTASGDVHFEGACDSMNVGTTSGAVEFVTPSCAKCKISTTSGDIVGTPDPACDLDISTTSGDVTLNDSAASVEIGTVSGAVTILRCGVAGKAEISTTSGSVRLGVTEMIGLTLDYDTVSGDLINPDVAMSQKDGRYTCAPGGFEAEVETVSGDLTVEKAE